MIELTNVKKPNKNQAYSIVMDLKLMLANGNGLALSENDVDQLLMFFAPATPAKPKTTFEWIAKAVADKKYRYPRLRFINVINGVAYACDGARMHWCNTDLVDGLYEPKTMLRLSEEAERKVGTAPDLLRLVKGHEEAEFESEWQVSELTAVDPKKAFKGVRINDTVSGDRKYWNDAISPGCHSLAITDASGNIYGKTTLGNFLIAPWCEPKK